MQGTAVAVLKDAMRWRCDMLRRAEARQDALTADQLCHEIQDLAQALYALTQAPR